MSSTCVTLMEVAPWQISNKGNMTNITSMTTTITTTVGTTTSTAAASLSLSSLSTRELLHLDRQHVWHPYAVAGPTATATATATSTTATTDTTMMDSVVPIESAHGVYLHVRPGSSYDNNHNIVTTTATNTNTTNTNDHHHHQRLVDGMSNWWATIHGYSHPTLNAAITQQLSQMSHIMLGGLTHEPVVVLCTKLCQLTQLDVCFVSDSGSVAVEVAMKMAIQYWNGRHRQCVNSNSNTKNNTNKKTKFITVRNGYHGDTFAAMSVSDPINGMHHSQFGGGTSESGGGSILQQHYFVPAPTPSYPNTTLNNDSNNNNETDNTDEFDESHLTDLIATLDRYHTTIAAMIIEPIVQGAGGPMTMYHPKYLCRVRQLCTEYDILLIYDEIATGFGRTNQWFGHDHCTEYYNDHHQMETNDNSNNTSSSSSSSSHNNNHKYKPDILCVGKALTGGYMSLAATITTNHVAEVIHTANTTDVASTSKPILMHGPTFMGNPLACSVALASISLLEQSVPLPATTTASSLPPPPPPQHTDTCTDWRRSVPMIERQLRHELMECTVSEHVQNVRVLGAIGVVEMKHPIHNMKLLQHTIVKEYGVWLRPFGKIIYTMPPFIISSEQLRKITSAIVQLTRRRF